MAKKKGWFGWVKRFFTSEAKTRTQKVGEFKLFLHCLNMLNCLSMALFWVMLISPVNLQKSNDWRWIFRRLEVLHQYPAQAALTAPERTLREATEEQKKHAFNVAMATAAAAEVVRLTSQPYHYFTKFDKNLAAIKIQSAYRAHLHGLKLLSETGKERIASLEGTGETSSHSSWQSCETPATTLKRSPSNRRGQAEIWKRSIPAANEG
ncbi:unnamed protein product [Prunus armeniaca]